MSSQWPTCHTCGASRGVKGRRKKRFDPTAQYLISAALTTVGTLIYGSQFLGRHIEPGTMRIALGVIVVGVLWYGTARIFALLR